MTTISPGGRSLEAPFLLLLLLTSLSQITVTAASAQETPSASSLVNLSIKELLDITLYSRELLGLHHTHPRGEWMLGYSYMDMSMEGNRDGTIDQSVADVLNTGFMVAPTAMTMKVHMFEFMYGLTDDATLMAMLPHKRTSMDHVNGAGTRFTTDASGVGDLSISAIFSVFQQDQHRVDLSAGLGIPTGSIDERGGAPLGPNQKLPYPMQLGSGTYDPVVGANYSHTGESWSWGTHLGHTFRVGHNSHDYTLGDRTQLDAWLVRQWAGRIAITARLHGEAWGNIDGADPELNPGMVPTADPARRGGKRIDIAVGASFYAGTGALIGSRLVIEFGFPAYESLDGPQLAREASLSLGLQWVF